MRTFTFQLLPGAFAVVRLAPDADLAPVLPWALAGGFFSVTKTDDELSIVCRQSQVPDQVRAQDAGKGPVRCDDDWACLKLVGPFAFDESGIVALISAALAAAEVGVLVISTYDSDHLLVKQTLLPTALAALREQGHRIEEIRTA